MSRTVRSCTQYLLDVVRAQKRGETRGIYAICSANRFVLEAAMDQALADGSAVLIESTSNQANQHGGYTGQTPADFAALVAEIARERGLPSERVLLGGDHLGPHPFRVGGELTAMEEARELVRQCVAAGYRKIHLDTSMRLADDPPAPLSAETITERAADLCAAAEDAFARLPTGSPWPLYVIGTDVPPPGGETSAGSRPPVTRVADAERTVVLSREAFARKGLEEAWERVVAVVVQPGVDFADGVIFDYQRDLTTDLSEFIAGSDRLVFEAHSTDYQTAQALRNLVEDQFAILKVGPGLTFAFREAIFALENVEQEWLSGRRGLVLSELRRAVGGAMVASPDHWQEHYRGDDRELQLARFFSYSDRIRYYWPRGEVRAALERLMLNLNANPAPVTLISQYLPRQSQAVRDGEIPNQPEAIIRHKIREITGLYSRSCIPAGPSRPRECSGALDPGPPPIVGNLARQSEGNEK